MAVELKNVSQSEDGLRLDRWFKIFYPDLNFIQLQKKCRKGEVRIDGKRCKCSDRISKGNVIRVPPLRMTEKPVSVLSDKTYSAADAEYVRQMVLYKNDVIVALNKPSGLATQGGTNTDVHIDGLSRYLHRDGQDKPRLVHRLDKDTSGVMVMAKTRKTASEFMQAFKNHKPRKVYWAVIVGQPEVSSGTIDMPLSKKTVGKGEKVVIDEEEGKRAITEFEVLYRLGGALTLVALWPKTGRTHQLRAHMAYTGTPILGDGKYGGNDAFVSDDKHSKHVHLHARSLILPDGITGVEAGLKITAELPKHILQTFEVWGVEGSFAEFDKAFGDL